MTGAFTNQPSKLETETKPMDTSENELALIRQLIREELRNELHAAQCVNHGNGSDGRSLSHSLESSALTDRRGMLKKVAGIAVGVATVGLLRPSDNGAAQLRSKTESSPTATGDPLLLGQFNAASGTDQTTIANATTDLSSVVFEAGNYGSVPFPTPANSRIALAAYTDITGATNTGFQYAIYAQANDGIGIYGQGGPGNCGCDGVCNGETFSYGIHGLSDIGLGGNFAGGRAAIQLDTGNGAVANPNASAPSGAGIGDLYRGTAGAGMVGAGSLWYKTGGGAADYRRIADQTTAGALTLFNGPVRLVDTRNGSGFAGAGNHLGTDTLQTYNIATLASLPAGARAMVGRITIVNATNSGGIQESPNPPPGMGNDLGFGTAVINYPRATTIPALGVPLISALDPSGNIRIRNVMISGSADVIIDITGYYL